MEHVCCGYSLETTHWVGGLFPKGPTSLVYISLWSRLIDVFVDFGEFQKEIMSGFGESQGFFLREMFLF